MGWGSGRLSDDAIGAGREDRGVAPIAVPKAVASRNGGAHSTRRSVLQACKLARAVGRVVASHGARSALDRVPVVGLYPMVDIVAIWAGRVLAGAILVVAPILFEAPEATCRAALRRARVIRVAPLAPAAHARPALSTPLGTLGSTISVALVRRAAPFRKLARTHLGSTLRCLGRRHRHGRCEEQW